MITKEDIEKAIAECQGVRNPNARTCIKLAAFLTIREYMFDDLGGESYENQSDTISVESNSEFFKVIDGKSQTDVFAVLNDAMESVKYFNPKLHSDIIRRLSEL